MPAFLHHLTYSQVARLASISLPSRQCSTNLIRQFVFASFHRGNALGTGYPSSLRYRVFLEFDRHRDVSDNVCAFCWRSTWADYLAVKCWQGSWASMFTIQSRGVAQQHGSEIEVFVARVRSCRIIGTDLWWNCCYTHWLFDASNTVLLFVGEKQKVLAQMRRGPTSSTSRRKQRRWQHTNLKPQEKIRCADSMSEFVLNNCLRMKQSSKLEDCLLDIHIAVPWNSEPAASLYWPRLSFFLSLSCLQYEGEGEPCSCMSRGPGRFNAVR